MNNSKIPYRAKLAGIVALTAMSLAWTAPAAAQAHLQRHHLHGHHHNHLGAPRISLSLGPYYGPWGYSPSFYDPYFYTRRWNDRPIVIEQPAPQVYVEQPQAYAQAAPTSNYWYFCEAAQAYWPYVKECPGGWQRVVPQPPPPTQ